MKTFTHTKIGLIGKFECPEFVTEKLGVNGVGRRKYRVIRVYDGGNAGFKLERLEDGIVSDHAIFCDKDSFWEEIPGHRECGL